MGRRVAAGRSRAALSDKMTETGTFSHLLRHALELPEEEQAPFLDQHCANDELRAELLALLDKEEGRRRQLPGDPGGLLGVERFG